MIADTPYKIELFRLLTLRGGLELELKGIKHRGRTAYSILKEELNLKGSREKVLQQVNLLLDSMKTKNLKRKGIA
jgi:hypothetical protein